MAEGNWKGIATEIASRIESGEFAPGSRLPSGDRFAAELGVNRNSAHRAIEELQRQGLVVRRQGSGTFVAEREAKKGIRVALLVDGYSADHNFPSGDLLRGIQDRIGEDSTLVIADSKHDVEIEERQLCRLAREADGVLIYTTDPQQPTALANLIDQGYPLVALDRIPHDLNIDAVVTDNELTVFGTVRSMIERGHQRIGFLGIDKPTFTSVVDRREGYRSAMAESGLDPDLLTRWLPEGLVPGTPIYTQLVQDAIFALRHGDEGMTALFCVEDGLGCAAVLACERLGIALPNDLEIATFIDWHPMTLRTPWNVRRLVQRKYDLGYAAAGLLLDRIASPDRPTAVVRVEADIISTDADYQELPASPTAFRLPTKEGQ